VKCLCGCRIGGRAIDLEIPLPRTMFYLSNEKDKRLARFIDLF
jgi:hypothetical protein